MSYFVAFFMGALSVAAYAPLELWWLMPLCLIVLFHLVASISARYQGFVLTFLFALGQFGVGASWIYVSLQTYGNMPVWMAVIAVFFFVALCALLTGLAGYCYAYLKRSSMGMLNVVLFSALWVLAEWTRSILFTGFPWLDVGYSQTTQLLSAFAPIGSVYLVSFVCVFASLCLFLCLKNVVSNNDKRIKKVLINMSVPAISLIVIVTSAALLQNVQWSQASGKTFSVAIVQGNVSIEEKWKRQFQSKILGDYFRQIQDYQADLVILAETALPVYLNQTDEDFWRQMKGQNKAILAGVVERDVVSGQIYNSANLVCGNANNRANNKANNNITQENEFYQGEQVYRKQHLVPFGEYLPMRKLLSWILDYLQIPMSDFSSGDQGQLLECDGLQISLSICYEDAFASELRKSLLQNEKNGILVNISEDAWFGNSLAPHQRVQMAQMRAMELSRPMLRSANSGPSTHINHQGKILNSTQQFVKDSMVVEVQPRTGNTPFAKYGMWIIFLCFTLIAVRLLFFLRMKN